MQLKNLRWKKLHKILFLIGLILLISIFTFKREGNYLDRSPCTLDVINSMFKNQDDPCLIEIIREQFLRPPSSKGLKVTRSDPKDDPSVGQAKIVRKLNNNQVGGFYVECGALDGETSSNTLYMERNLNWKGLLIEADPKNYKILQAKHRDAWTLPACVSNDGKSKIVSFYQDFDIGRAVDLSDRVKRPSMVEVQCFPFYSILLALNRTQVDFFSLDIEGDELKVLKTIPWDLVDIKILAVEYLFVPEGKTVLANYMKEKGYRIAAEYNRTDWRAYDYIFVKN